MQSFFSGNIRTRNKQIDSFDNIENQPNRNFICIN